MAGAGDVGGEGTGGADSGVAGEGQEGGAGTIVEATNSCRDKTSDFSEVISVKTFSSMVQGG